MKKFVTVFFLIINVALSLVAHEYVPMIREDRVWKYSGGSNLYDTDMYHYMKFEGTSTVNGIDYNRFIIVKSEYKDLSSGIMLSYENNGNHVFYLRENAGKVYVLCYEDRVVDFNIFGSSVEFIDPEKLSEFKAYDFTLVEDEQVEYPSYCILSITDTSFVYTVNHKKSITIGGETCKVLTFKDNSVMGLSDEPQFIEGIGTTCNGNLAIPNLGNVSGRFDNTYYPTIQSVLLEVTDLKGNVIYKPSDTNSVRQISSDLDNFMYKDGVIYLNNQESMITLRVYGTDGTLLVSESYMDNLEFDCKNFPKGTYIVELKANEKQQTLKIRI